MATMKAFTRCHGEVIELTNTYYCPEQYAATELSKYDGQERFVKVVSARGPGYIRYDFLGGLCPCGKRHFAERLVQRPAYPSNHKCDGRCMSARGPKCECSCGGKNHGAN